MNTSGVEGFASAEVLAQALSDKDVSPLMFNLALRCAIYGLLPTQRFETQQEVNRYVRATSEKLELEHGIVNKTAREVAAAFAAAFATFDATAAAATAQQRPMGIKLRNGVVTPASRPAVAAAPAPAPAPVQPEGKKKGLLSFFSRKK